MVFPAVALGSWAGWLIGMSALALALALVVLGAIVLGARGVAGRFDARIRRAVDEVQALAPPDGTRNSLPPLLEAFVARAGCGEGDRVIRIEQEGEMRLRPDAAWLPFRATQVIGVTEPAFVWDARFAKFRVVDALVHGVGWLEARLLGVMPVAKAGGRAATRAQLLRYFAEIAWAPGAIAANPHVTWEQIGEREVLGSIEAGGERGELHFEFDDAGDIRRVHGLRERDEKHGPVERPWIGAFSDYATIDGVRIPTRGEVSWVLDSGSFPYWRGRICPRPCRAQN